MEYYSNYLKGINWKKFNQEKVKDEKKRLNMLRNGCNHSWSKTDGFDAEYVCKKCGALK